MQIETDRLLIMPWALEDQPLLKDLFHDEGFLTFFPEKYHHLKTDEDGLRAHLQERIDNYINHGFCKFPVFLKSTMELVGTCGVGYFDDLGPAELELGVRLRKKHWRSGFGSEASRGLLIYLRNQFKIKTIYAYILLSNLPSQSAVLQFGFKYLQNIELDGIWHKLYNIELDSIQ